MRKTALERLSELLRKHPELSETKDSIVSAAELVCRSYRAGGKVLVCGNGGSASDSEHIVGELMKSFAAPRRLPKEHLDLFGKSGFPDWQFLSDKLQRAVPAIALTGHPALCTAIQNDIDPSMVFAQQVYAYARREDLLIGLSTSGRARNVINALKVARVMGLTTVGFTGAGNAEFEELCDVVMKAPERETHLVQESHLPIYHTICLMVEQELFANEAVREDAE